MNLADELVDVIEDICNRLEEANVDNTEQLIEYARDLSLAVLVRVSQLEDIVCA